MPKKAYKRMMQREKEQRKSIRAELRAEGLIPPVKPRLNRAAFCKETMQMWEDASKESPEIMPFYLSSSIGALVANPDYSKITPEMIGVLKLMRIAIGYHAFEVKKKSQGETRYAVKELYDEVIEPILKL